MGRPLPLPLPLPLPASAEAAPAAALAALTVAGPDTCRSRIWTSAIRRTSSVANTTLLAPLGGSSHTLCPVLPDWK